MSKIASLKFTPNCSHFPYFTTCLNPLFQFITAFIESVFLIFYQLICRKNEDIIKAYVIVTETYNMFPPFIVFMIPGINTPDNSFFYRK